MPALRLALAQINLTVGDLEGNVKKVLTYLHLAQKKGVHMIAFPELTLCGYLPEDLLFSPQFVQDNLDALQQVAKKSDGLVVIVGFVDRQEDLYNAAAVIYEGEIRLVHHKQYLPNYGIFDEARYFKPGQGAAVFRSHHMTLGVNICEDIWHAEGPVVAQAFGGSAQIIINMTASPYHVGKPRLREQMLSRRAKENRVIVAYVNQVGGQDEWVFDGGSLVYNQQGRLIARGPFCKEELLVVDLEVDPASHTPQGDSYRRTVKPLFLQVPVCALTPTRDQKSVRSATHAASPCRAKIAPCAIHPIEEMYHALLLGLTDYVQKNNFSTVTLGLSGGIDSALVATLAVDALGKEHVMGVFMPSRYTHAQSAEDAQQLAKNLGMRILTLPIEESFQSFLNVFSGPFHGLSQDTTEENLQARIRGMMLMALSNKFGWLVLTTGNKSELSVGYATLYGDMAGGFAVIKDVWKTSVYALAKWRNLRGLPIPLRILRRRPTAELAHGQRDTDTLPPYAILDDILRAEIEGDDSAMRRALRKGVDKALIIAIRKRIHAAEFKRRQAPIGIKITPRAFGRDRRMPITHRYLDTTWERDAMKHSPFEPISKTRS